MDFFRRFSPLQSLTYPLKVLGFPSSFYVKLIKPIMRNPYGAVMKRIEIYGLKIAGDIDSETDLAKLIVEEAERQAYGIREGDVIVITSKIS